MIASTRSYLTAGLSAGLVLAATGSAVVAPTAGPPPIRVASPAVALTAAFPQLPVVDFSGVAESPGDWIINAYGVVQPWVEYGVELFAWATEWLPWPIGLLAPQSDIIYSGWQPFAESVVYSFAFLVDGEFDLIVPTLSAGIQTGISNLVQGEIAWILSFFPPLPPIGIAAAEAAASARSAGRTALPASAAVSTEAAVSETAVSESAHTSTPGTAAELEAAPVAVAEPEAAPVAVAEPEAAPVAVAEPEAAQVAVAEPEAAVPPAPRATRGAARMPRTAPAASAAAVTDVIAAPSQASAQPATRKASRGADSPAGPGRATRAAR